MERNLRTVLLLGTFTRPLESIENFFALTENAKIFDMNLKGALSTFLVSSGPFIAESKVRMLPLTDPTAQHYLKKYDGVAVVHLGPQKFSTGLEISCIKVENIIQGIVFAIKYLKAKHFNTIHIDSCEHPKIVGTAVALSLPTLGPTKFNAETMVSVEYFDEFHFGGEAEFEEGLCFGKGQILAQQLMKSPGVSEFVEKTKSYFGESDVTIVERNEEWMREMKMFCLLSVAKSSHHRPVILELIYDNSPKLGKPLVLVGKASPYENSLFPLKDKPEFHQYQYRSGMGGASSIVGSLYTLCELQAPIRVHCIIAIVWNQLHDKSNRKGDVISAMNGTSIQIDSTEAEGRLVMADILCYADTLDSTAIMDVTTLSSNIDSLVGNSYTAFFTSHDLLGQILCKSSTCCGEKVWHFPLYKCYSDLLKKSSSGYLSNVGEDEKSATAFKSAAFLREFVSRDKPWIHLDISAVSESRGKKNYLLDWATGRSTRLVAEFCLAFAEESETEF